MKAKFSFVTAIKEKTFGIEEVMRTPGLYKPADGEEYVRILTVYCLAGDGLASYYFNSLDSVMEPLNALAHTHTTFVMVKEKVVIEA